jgi:hypothetical protein
VLQVFLQGLTSIITNLNQQLSIQIKESKREHTLKGKVFERATLDYNGPIKIVGFLLLGLTQVQISNRFPTKPSKTIGPPGKPEGNTMHRVHYAVSPEIALWVTAMLKCLQSRNEWGSGNVFYLLHAFIMLFIQYF